MTDRCVCPKCFGQEFSEMSIDERAIVWEVAERLRKGREEYGPMDLRKMERDLSKDAYEEALDLVIYRAMRAVRERYRRGEG